ncbi:MAG: hypothetical protein JSS04_17070 [Proteobacteria bacterium]|nr:hypothetical protein [Pseudomonadota bacterium]
MAMIEQVHGPMGEPGGHRKTVVAVVVFHARPARNQALLNASHNRVAAWGGQ